MRITFLNMHYRPDVASTAQHLTDLAEYLVGQGHEVHVLTSMARYDAGGRVGTTARVVLDGVRVTRLSLPSRGRARFAERMADYVLYLGKALLHGLFRARPDVYVALSTPPLLALVVAIVAGVRRRPFLIWSMDLHPEVEAAAGVISHRSLTYRLLKRVHDRAFRRAAVVVSLGPAMTRQLRAKGVQARRIVEIPVWSRTDEIEPMEKESSPLLDAWELRDRFVVMYSGNAGMAHCFAPVLDAMERLRERDDVFFLFVGGGPRRPEIEAEARRRGIRNFAYRDYVQRAELSDSLALGDVHLVTLGPDQGGLVAPGKVFGIMAAARPIIFTGPRDSEPGHYIARSGCGILIDSCQAAAGADVVTAIEALRTDPARARELGRAGRRAFEELFAFHVVRGRWAELFHERAGPLASAVPRGTSIRRENES